jgi:hypothetical protein
MGFINQLIYGQNPEIAKFIRSISVEVPKYIHPNHQNHTCFEQRVVAAHLPKQGALMIPPNL